MSAYVHIRKALELFKNRPSSLRIGITSEEAAHEISLITSVAEEFEAIGTQLAKEGNAGTDVNILALIQLTHKNEQKRNFSASLTSH